MLSRAGNASESPVVVLYSSHDLEGLYHGGLLSPSLRSVSLTTAVTGELIEEYHS